jgi:PKD repeat protein
MVTYSIKVGVSEASETGAIFVYPPLEPIARFSARPRYGEKPLKVYFTNKSLGTVDTFDWDFGGDLLGKLEHSPDHSPIYTYKTPATYSVTLSITGPDGSDSKTKTNYITVVDPATELDANFRAPRSQRSVLWEDTPVTVDFEDRSIGNHDTWEWDFSYDENDGFNVEATIQKPSHVYTGPGLYSVALKVENTSPFLEDQKVKLNYIVIYEQ